MPLKNILLCTCISFVLLFQVECTKQRLLQKVIYKGVVVRLNVNHTPVPDRLVSLKGCGHRFGKIKQNCEGEQVSIGNDVTDANGHFSIEGKASRTDIYFIECEGSPLAGSSSGIETNSKGLQGEEFDTLFVLN